MSVLRLLRTTTFRFTIIYVLLFAFAVGLLGWFFYQSTFGVVSKQTDSVINQEVQVLAEVFQRRRWRAAPGCARTRRLA
ncbi:MAG: hypothetical protein R3C40_11540 [Parvularculaceae bacterium]